MIEIPDLIQKSVLIAILLYLFKSFVDEILSNLSKYILNNLKKDIASIWEKIIKYLKSLNNFKEVTSTFDIRNYELSTSTFVIGNYKTSFTVVDGDGQMTYSSDDIHCIDEGNKIVLPPEIEKHRKKIEQLEINKNKKGLDFKWDGPLFALKNYAVERTNPEENMSVTFTFQRTTYFKFLATVGSLKEKILLDPENNTIEEYYLKEKPIRPPIPFLANGFGVALVVVSKDDKLILTRRSSTTGIRTGELDISILEGVHPDKDCPNHFPDLYKTAIRGAREELGIEEDEIENIKFLGFGVDWDYYQWNIIGFVKISENADYVKERYLRGTPGKWETENILEPIKSDPKFVFEKLKENKIWSTGFVAIYWTLLYNHKKKNVEEAAEKIFCNLVSNIVQ